ncbi:MAG: hypothetical protein P8Y67_11135 [Alphaproteobacteria bacterium]
MHDDTKFHACDSFECHTWEASDEALGEQPNVRKFHQIVLWPLQLISTNKNGAPHGYHSILEEMGDTLWTSQGDKFGGTGDQFDERHYREFISFLPHVQRFIYGDSRGANMGGELRPGDISMRVYQRHDIKRVRVKTSPDDAPVICDVLHTGLFFFYDVDAVILVCEITAENIPLNIAQKLMQRFGRAYPAGWRQDGRPIHCPVLVEWLGDDDKVLATSDYHVRERYLRFVEERRASCIASHWEFFLAPIVNDASDTPGALRIREIEYYRMPVMAYIALEDLKVLRKTDYISLSLATSPPPRDKETLPFSERFLQRFETHHKYERLYAGGLDAPGIETRFLTCGEAFTIVSAGVSDSMNDLERGLLSQFRHQYFLLFLIAHFHKSSLLMISDRMVGWIKRLEPLVPESVQAFRDGIFKLQENFLRFSQRYYFTQISGRSHIRDMFHMVREHLVIDQLHEEVRSEITDMVHYLDSNTLRKQSGSMHRLTVVTILGMIGTIATGFLGMNLLAEAESPFSMKAVYFGIVTLIAGGLTVFSLVFSGPISRFFEKVSGDERKK